jgi:TPR repeat protein
MRDLGEIYEEGGYGLTSDLTEAKRWYETAVKAGEQHSAKHLERVRKKMAAQR